MQSFFDEFTARLVAELREELAERYEFVDFLGKGASSLVFRVRNLALSRLEALKVLFSQSADNVARFRREAQLAASLDHPNIAKIYSFGESRGYLWYTMQLVEGPSLAQFLRVNGRLEPRLVVQLAVPLLEALDYAHSLGIVHRDIKPANIMLTPSFKACLVDFGLAKELGGAEMTQSHTALGTPAYMAPEQAAGGKPDGRADIYSFSVTLYEALSGQRPFPGDDVLKVLMARLTQDPRPLAEVCPDCPENLAAVIMKGMARNPASRFASAAEMALALQEALEDAEEAKPPAPEVVEAARPAPVELETALTQVLRDRPTATTRKTPKRWAVPILAAMAMLSAFGLWSLRTGRQVPELSSPGTGRSDPLPLAPTPLFSKEAVSLTPTPLPPPTLTRPPTPKPSAVTPVPRAVRPPEVLGSTVVALRGELATLCVGSQVGLLVEVKADGSTGQVRVLRPGPPPCTEQALNTVRALRWRPAESATGEPVEGRAALVIEFGAEKESSEKRER